MGGKRCEEFKRESARRRGQILELRARVRALEASMKIGNRYQRQLLREIERIRPRWAKLERERGEWVISQEAHKAEVAES